MSDPDFTDLPEVRAEEMAALQRIYSDHPPKRPAEPMRSRPGSRARIIEMTKRLERGEAIFRDGDLTIKGIPDGIAFAAGGWHDNGKEDRAKDVICHEQGEGADRPKTRRERRSA